VFKDAWHKPGGLTNLKNHWQLAPCRPSVRPLALRGWRLHWKREMPISGSLRQRLRLYRQLELPLAVTLTLVMHWLHCRLRERTIAAPAAAAAAGACRTPEAAICAAYAWRWFLTYSAWFSGSRRKLAMPGVCSWWRRRFSCAGEGLMWF
jgi:hypothetical protein